MTRQQQIATTLYTFYKKPVAQVSLELFLSIGAVIFFAVFAIRPTLLTMADLVKEIEDERLLDQQFQQKVAALSTVQTVYLNLRDRLSVLDNAIPSSPEFITSVKLIEKVASENDLLISTILVNEIPPEVPGDIDTPDLKRQNIPISVTVTGSYGQIRSFIEGILSLQRTFVVDTIVFGKTDERGQEKLSATITLSAPFYSKKL